MKYEFLDLHIASDGWPFYVQPDGTASDTPDPTLSGLTFETIGDLYAFDTDVRRGTISDHVKYAQQRIDHGYPCENDEKLVIWYRGTLA
tara:strand:- start:81 stop:347 length:267 start_codon:yes stop_codon:yes gene_type:complete